MKHTTSKYNLTSAGFLIVQNAHEAMQSNPYRKTFGLYCGVDRLPPFGFVTLESIGLTQQLPERLSKEDLNEWFDSRVGNTAFIAELNNALRLLRRVHTLGFQLELLYCQLAWNENESDRLKDYAIVSNNTPPVSTVFGFDVSWPTCKHSAILQPGVVQNNPAWRSQLNDYGLLSSYEDAVRVRDEYLAVYPYPPFDIYLVAQVALMPFDEVD